MDAFDVLPLDAAKEYLNERGDTNAAEIASFIPPAVDRVGRHLGEEIVDVVITETVTARSGRVWLTHRPVKSVATVQHDSLTTWPVGQLAVDQAAGSLRAVGGRTLTGDVTVTYTAGRTTVTDDEVLACKMVLAEYWDTQRPSAGPAAPGYGQTASPADTAPRSRAPLRTRLTEILGEPAPLVA